MLQCYMLRVNERVSERTYLESEGVYIYLESEHLERVTIMRASLHL